jgi:hypothetical protein
MKASMWLFCYSQISVIMNVVLTYALPLCVFYIYLCMYPNKYGTYTFVSRIPKAIPKYGVVIKQRGVDKIKFLIFPFS